eukprot:4443458-Heterocapsa_arctica.AAC.1
MRTSGEFSCGSTHFTRMAPKLIKLDTNYPQFTPEGTEVLDVKAEELFLIICQPTSRTGALRFPKFIEVIEWIQAIRKDIDVSIKDNPNWADPSLNPSVIAFSADDRPE